MRAQRLAWGAQSEEEARVYRQGRLAMFSKALFWAFVALVVFLFAMYTAYPEIKPGNQNLIYGVATLALATLAVLWRGLLVRGIRSEEFLNGIDLVLTIGSGCTFGIVAPLAYELEAAAYTCLLYESFVVFTRALLVPSSVRRTFIVSSLAFVPIVAGSVVLAILDWKGIADLEIPGLAFVGGNLVYNAVAILLATTGTRIIYNLSKQVSEAKHLGQYTLVARIGVGGMGAVYRATHALLRRDTAIKLILPDSISDDTLNRFEEEVQAMSRLTHPNSVAVFDYGRGLNGELYYAMELLDGLNLHQLASGKPQAASRVVRILIQVCGALQEAHDKKLVHRDIKPANIILCERGGLFDVVKVVDYGLVQAIKDAAVTNQSLAGTPGYLAPESVLHARFGFEVDLYALGATAYFLLTGKPAFPLKTASNLVERINDKPTPFAEATTNLVPPALESIILKCLAKEPTDRYASAAALADALDKALAEVPTLADWDRGHAKAWWETYWKQVAMTPRTDTPTLTLMPNLDNRSPVPQPPGPGDNQPDDN